MPQSCGEKNCGKSVVAQSITIYPARGRRPVRCDRSELIDRTGPGPHTVLPQTQDPGINEDPPPDEPPLSACMSSRSAIKISMRFSIRSSSVYRRGWKPPGFDHN